MKNTIFLLIIWIRCENKSRKTSYCEEKIKNHLTTNNQTLKPIYLMINLMTIRNIAILQICVRKDQHQFSVIILISGKKNTENPSIQTSGSKQV